MLYIYINTHTYLYVQCSISVQLHIGEEFILCEAHVPANFSALKTAPNGQRPVTVPGFWQLIPVDATLGLSFLLLLLCFCFFYQGYGRNWRFESNGTVSKDKTVYIWDWGELQHTHNVLVPKTDKNEKPGYCCLFFFLVYALLLDLKQ